MSDFFYDNSHFSAQKDHHFRIATLRRIFLSTFIAIHAPDLTLQISCTMTFFIGTEYE